MRGSASGYSNQIAPIFLEAPSFEFVHYCCRPKAQPHRLRSGAAAARYSGSPLVDRIPARSVPWKHSRPAFFRSQPLRDGRSSGHFRRTSSILFTNQHALRRGCHSAASFAPFSYRCTRGLASVRFSTSRANRASSPRSPSTDRCRGLPTGAQYVRCPSRGTSRNTARCTARRPF